MRNVLKNANRLKEGKDETDNRILDIGAGIHLGTLNGFAVMYWPKVMKEHNEILGMATFSKLILVDDEFLNLSDYGKMNTLYHELGHLEKKHLELYSLDEYLKLRKEYSNNDSVLPIELEADSYSYEKLKKYGKEVFIEAMMETFDACIKHGRDSEEVIRRIKHFK